MSDQAELSRRAIVRVLRRIRAVESPPDDEGIRTVWHQGAKGADLVSYVNRDGRVTRQELTLLGEHVLWVSGQGLRTGEVSGERAGSRAGPASGMVSLDAHVEADRVFRAARAFEIYDGEDKYLLHLKRVLRLSAQGLEDNDSATVTHAYSPGEAGRAVEAVRAEQQGPMKRFRAALIGGAIFVAVLLLASIFLHF